MEQEGGVIISAPLARRLGLHLGDTLTVPTPAGNQPFRVVGVMKDITPVGGTLQLDRQDYLKYWQDETATNVGVLLTDPAAAATVRQTLLERWGDSHNLLVRTREEFYAEIRAQIDSFYAMMDGLTWIAILVACLAIANTLFASILERKREFAMLRAVGARRGEVVRVVLGEALSTGLVGGIFGVAGGLVLQTLFVNGAEFINGTTLDWLFPWGPVVTAVVVAVLLAPLAGLLPARRVARLDVVEALRYE
jgi:putative ABC transport system permease protein